MNELNFCYWLQGFFEIHNFKDGPLTIEQVKMIKDHLQYVFDHKVLQSPTITQPNRPMYQTPYFRYNDQDPFKFITTY